VLKGLYLKKEKNYRQLPFCDVILKNNDVEGILGRRYGNGSTGSLFSFSD
jgi:hypothetical protein